MSALLISKPRELIWQSQALCANANADTAALFFSEDLPDIAAAKKMCANCPVMDKCLESALDRNEQFGVWGGQLFDNGKIVAIKRRRGRPRKVARPEDEVPVIPIPERLRPRLAQSA